MPTKCMNRSFLLRLQLKCKIVVIAFVRGIRIISFLTFNIKYWLNDAGVRLKIKIKI